MKISMNELRNLIESEVKRSMSEQSDINWAEWDSLDEECYENNNMSEQSSDDIDWSSWDMLDEDDYDMYEYDFMSEDSKKDGFVPPQSVAKTAERALKWREEHGRGGTEVGVARARDLKNRKSLSRKTINRMKSYFARHAVDKKAPGFHSETDPSAGRIAWDLWGGDAGAKWVRGIKDLDESMYSYGEIGEHKPYQVWLWATDPDLNEDTLDTVFDFDTQEEAEALFSNHNQMPKYFWPLEGKFLELQGPDGLYAKKQVPGKRTDDDNDDDWRREQAMQAGMGVGVDAYNDVMGWDLNRGR